MAGIMYDNRTLTFGADDQLKITEKELIEAILYKHSDLDDDDVKDLVVDLIDALDAHNNSDE